MSSGRNTFLAIALAALSLPCAASAVETAAVPRAAQGQGGKAAAYRCPGREKIENTLAQASSMLAQARYEEAARMLETLTSSRCDPRAYLLQAAAYEETGDAAKAKSILQTAHSIWPLNSSIATSLAREYMNGGQIDMAVQALAKFHATAETPRQELQEAAVVFIAAHHLRSAEVTAETLNNRYPGLSSLLLLANVLQLEGRYKDVNQMLGKQRAAYADSSPFLITFAESEYDAMLYDAARTDLERAVSIDQNSYQAHYLLGNVFVAQNQTERAEKEYRAAIALDPGQPRTYYQLALLLHSEQRDDAEMPLLEQAIASNHGYAPAHCEMGRILLGRRQLREAVTELKMAIEDNPQLEQAYYLLARAYAGLGQMEKADQMVSKYKALRAANRHTSPDTQQDQSVTEHQ